jgi:hypothetical protein
MESYFFVYDHGVTDDGFAGYGELFFLRLIMGLLMMGLPVMGFYSIRGKSQKICSYGSLTGTSGTESSTIYDNSFDP